MLKLQTIGWVALVVAILGSLSWGLVGLFEFNIVETIFGEMTPLSRIFYIITGFAGLYLFLVPLMAVKWFHLPMHRPKPA